VTRDEARWEAAEEGAELLREGENERAIATLEGVLRDDSENAYAAFFLGNAHFEKERWDKALKAYVRALELAPDYLGAMIGAGHALRMKGELDRAIRMGNAVLSRRAEDADALHLLGLVHLQRDERAKAREYFHRFLATKPEAEVVAEVQGLLQILDGEMLPLPDNEDAN
jgi:cytochrome c-type biogenesis protein CcmH/NrfG